MSDSTTTQPVPKSPPPFASGELTFREAADLLDVSLSTLKRRHRDGSISEAVRRNGVGGDQWALLESDLGQIAEANGWSVVVNLTDRTPEIGHDSSLDSGQSLGLNQVELRELIEEKARLTAEAVAGERVRDTLRNERDQARRDLEAESKQRGQLEEDIKRLETDLVAATTSADERQKQIETKNAEIRQHIERTDAKELAIKSLVERAVRAEASMGWFAKRRWQKASNSE